MTDSRTVELAKQLIARPSVTPKDEGCQEIISNLLQKLDFTITNMPFNDTTNLWASRGTGSPHLVFLGHTDVVPPGDEKLWLQDPYTPTIIDDKLYGRGVADMKGGIAAMIAATEIFVQENPQHKGTISFLITSDEEGPAHDGTKRVVEKLQADKVKIDYCLLGEPGSQNILGDTLKLGARGSLTGTAIFTGKQGHVGHPHKAKNPIHAVLNTLHELTEIVWDKETAEFQATGLQITNIRSGVGATNVIPETMYCQFNIRYAPTITTEQLKTSILKTLDKQPLPYEIEWSDGAEPFVSRKGELTNVCSEVVEEVMGITPVISNVGGTNDARFIVKTGCEAVELGLLNTTIHAVNEHSSCQDLDNLSRIYLKVLHKIMNRTT